MIKDYPTVYFFSRDISFKNKDKIKELILKKIDILVSRLFVGSSQQNVKNIIICLFKQKVPKIAKEKEKIALPHRFEFGIKMSASKIPN